MLVRKILIAYNYKEVSQKIQSMDFSTEWRVPQHKLCG